MRKDRLLKLADFIDTVPPEKFNMSYWWQETPACGTVACALGWATAIPEFAEAGLRVESEHVCYRHSGRVDCGFSAATEFFGLDSRHDAYYLFDPAEYDKYEATTAKQVAERIRQYVGNEGR